MEKDIQLTGIGNALVDLQYEMQNDGVESLGMSKGEMKLADAEEQSKLIQKLGDKEHFRCSGGSVANSMIAFSKFGGRGAFQTTLGNDELGLFYSNEFKELDIIVHAELLDSQPTGTCVVLITPDAERTMHSSLGASAHYAAANLNEDLIRRSEWIYIEGYRFTSPEGVEACAAAMDMAQKYDTKIAVTFSDRFVTETFRDDLERVTKNADLIFCNELEAQSFTQTDNIEDAYKALSENYKNTAVTLGARGSRIRWEGKDYEIPPYETKPLDTTGAGDMYSAGVLFGLINGCPPEKAGRLGAYAASRVISQFGARLNEDHRAIAEEILDR